MPQVACKLISLCSLLIELGTLDQTPLHAYYNNQVGILLANIFSYKNRTKYFEAECNFIEEQFYKST